MYTTAIVNQVAKPSQPVANFAVTTDGLDMTCQNQATGESGWWDFGDGAPLEPFDPAQPSVAHKFAKPGNYSVKLTVRNFLMEENSRSVPVDLTPAALPPSITGLTVESIGGPKPVAPAAFRIKGEVKNAESIILDLGDKVEVNTETGPFERLVVFEKPGEYPIQVIATTGKTVTNQRRAVTVSPSAEGIISVILRVNGTGHRHDRHEHLSTPVLTHAAGAKMVERVVAAKPGHVILEAKVGKVTSQSVSNLKTEVAPDHKSVKISADWTGPSTTGNAPGGGDVMVPLLLVEEREKPATEAAQPETASAVFPGANSNVILALPPQPHGMSEFQRKIALEIRQARAAGQSTLFVNEPDVKFPWTKTIDGPGFALTFNATLVGEHVQILLTQTQIQAGR
ncbi:hypothetical protein FRUB_09937 [Fimbriiglobus ruber]|uniref:PKD domain-containing protein n=1 Tax=Fimbriiglobus ruber TaxID=1908690 RepID=A0A225DFC2_9BACT|nr:hypothetical protein FRUB_09937 [Fimbriiglobus ruber]